MENVIELVDSSKCTGCAACSNVCSTGSIAFVAKGLHYYPSVDADTCIKCGRCMQVCAPLNWGKAVDSRSESAFVPTYYCAWNDDEKERRAATSGGIGGALVSRALELGYHVCGAAFSSDWILRHVISDRQEIKEQVRGSKYLQSDTRGTYKSILELVRNGEKVLFLGTPCQTDALRNVIPGKYRDQLLTCEIICHGVNSPIVWDHYKNYIQRKFKSALTFYNFRSKSKGWGVLRTSYGFANGKKVDEPGWKNIFHSWFGQHYMMRESCFRCPYRSVERLSDLVIGDFWGIDKIAPRVDVKSGASVIIENTQKGRDFFEGCSVAKFACEADKALSVLKGYVDNMPEAMKRIQIARMKNFEEDYDSHSFEQMVSIYPAESVFRRYFKIILYHLHLSK